MADNSSGYGFFGMSELPMNQNPATPMGVGQYQYGAWQPGFASQQPQLTQPFGTPGLHYGQPSPVVDIGFGSCMRDSSAEPLAKSPSIPMASPQTQNDLAEVPASVQPTTAGASVRTVVITRPTDKHITASDNRTVVENSTVESSQRDPLQRADALMQLSYLMSDVDEETLNSVRGSFTVK